MLRKICITLVVCYICAIPVLALRSPSYDWDMVGYIAWMFSFETRDTAAVHEKTYSAIQNAVPPNVYADLTLGTSLGADHSTYRKAIAQNPDYLAQQLPFYGIKPLYAVLIYLASKVGLNPVKAAVIISSLMAFLTCFLGLFWFRNAPPHIYILLLFLIGGADMLFLARVTTPDALSAFVLMLSMFLLIRQERPYLACIFLVLSIFARMDNLIFALLVFSYLRFIWPNRSTFSGNAYVSFTAAALLSYFLISHFSGNYGWQTVIANTFFGFIPNPAEYHPTISVVSYLRLLSKEAVEFSYDSRLSIFMMCALMAMVIHFAVKNPRYIYPHLTAIVVLYIAIRFILFPHLEDRYFAFHYLFIGISLIAAVAQLPTSQLYNRLSWLGSAAVFRQWWAPGNEYCAGSSVTDSISILEERG